MVHDQYELVILNYLKDLKFSLIQTPAIEAIKDVACLRFRRGNQQIEIAVKDYFETSTNIHLNTAYVVVVVTAPSFMKAMLEIKSLDIE